jgi:hypothetical protein
MGSLHFADDQDAVEHDAARLLHEADGSERKHCDEQNALWRNSIAIDRKRGKREADRGGREVAR